MGSDWGDFSFGNGLGVIIRKNRGERGGGI